MNNGQCSICNGEISCGTPYVGTGTGVAHAHCYERQNQPTIALSLHQVARGHRDPVIAAQVISEMVPEELAKEIVKAYNRRLLLQWQKRCEEPE